MRTFTLMLPVVLVVVCVSVLQANTIHVPSQQPTVQAGIDVAVDGDTVLVADGIYTGDGNRDVDFLGKAISVMSENGAENCIIDCEGSEEVPHRGFIFQSGEDSTSILHGFTITGGHVGDSDGGGINCVNNSSPTIIGNTISGNTAYAGGGISCENSSPTIIGNAIHWNYTVWGGGIRCSSSSPIISRNTIWGNTGEARGGGIYCNTSSPIITENLIVHNTNVQGWDGSGGGIDCFISSPSIMNNTILWNTVYNNGGGISCRNESSPIIEANLIIGNVAAVGGGGIRSDDTSLPLLRKNTISKNRAFQGGGIHSYASLRIENNTITSNTASVGGGYYCDYYSNSTVLNSIFWNNEILVSPSSSIVVSYSDVMGGWPGEGNIDEDPMFVLPEKDDYRILWGSPCIDTGRPGPQYKDSDGTRCDMGAHYFNQLDYLTLYVTPDTIEVLPGGQLGVTYTAINRWGWPQPFWAVSTVAFAGGLPDIIMGPDKYELPAKYTAQVHTVYNVPPNAPQGVYDCWSGVGLPPGIVFDEDSFRFWVVE